MNGTPGGEHVADTSERLNSTYYLSDREDAFIYACHIARYDIARPYVRGQRVRDFGCGTGYGTHRLAAEGAEITGVDVSHKAVRAASEAFVAPGLSFQRCAKVEDSALPSPDERFDVVLSFQVFEHVRDTAAYLRGVHRVLAPGDTFVCVTPDRRSRMFPGQRAWNRHHIQEYSQVEMAGHLRRYFDSVEVSGMTGRADLLEAELARVRKVKSVTYPATFAWVPVPLRVKGLELIKMLQSQRTPVPEAAKDIETKLSDWGFDGSDVQVFSHGVPSLNVVCVAREAD